MNDIIEGQAVELGQNESMAQALTRAEIDMQIATAQMYPRSLTKVSRAIKTLATHSKAAAQECIYAVPRGGKTITGPSIRLAEIVYSQWGNSRTGARVVHVDRKEKFVEAEGVFHDLETNAAMTKRVRRSIQDRNGNIFSADMITVAGQAACAIALRNAILAGIPRVIWNEGYEAAMKTVRGDVETLPERRSAAMKAMNTFGLTDEKVFAILGVNGMPDIDIDVLITLSGIHSALKNEETTVEALMASIEEPRPTRQAGSITNRPKAEKKPESEEKPKPNSEAERALQAEAERAAKAREGEANRKAQEDAELAALQAEYQSEAGTKPDGRWGADRLRSELEELRTAQSAPAPETEEEEPQQPEDEPEIEDSPEIRPDPEAMGRMTKAFDDIVGDLLDGDPDEVVDMWQQTIDEMAAVAPALHESLMQEIEAAKE